MTMASTELHDSAVLSPDTFQAWRRTANGADWAILWLFASILTVPLSGEITLSLYALYALAVTALAVRSTERDQLPWRELLLVALAIASITLVKALSWLWSVNRASTVTDVGTHLHFLFWLPLTLLFCRARTPVQSLLHGVRICAVVLAIWALWMWTQKGWPPHAFPRLQAGAQNAGVLGQLATMNTLWLAWAWQRRTTRANLLFMLLSAVAVIAAGGRSHIGVMLIGLIFAAFLVWRAQPRSRWRNGILVCSVLLTAMVIYAFTPRIERAWREASEYVVQPAKAVRTSVGNRVGLYDAALHAFPDAPWLGFGAGTTKTVAPRYLAPGRKLIVTSHYHQQTLQVLLETGIVGLLLCLAALATVSRWFYRNRHTAPAAWPLYVALVYAVAAVGVFTGSLQQGLLHTFIVAALAVLGAQCIVDRKNLSDSRRHLQ